MRNFILIIILGILCCNLYCEEKITTLGYDNKREITLILKENNIKGEPILVRLIIKNITDKNIMFPYEHTSMIFDIKGKNYYRSIITMPSFPKKYPEIILKPNEYIVEDYLIPAFGLWKTVGYPSGDMKLKYYNISIPITVINNNDNSAISAIQFLESETYLPGKTNINEISELCISEKNKCKDMYLLKFLDYFDLVKSIQFYKYAQKDNKRFPKEDYNKNKYKIESPVSECYKFLEKYPDDIYFSHEIKKILFEEIAKKSKSDFIKMMTENYAFFNTHYGEMILLLDKYNQLYGTNYKWDLQ